jgi:adenylosuccinate synthase
MLNGVTALIMTKADVLSGFKVIKVCKKYNTTEGIIDYFPHDLSIVQYPVYEELPAWSTDLTEVRKSSDFPAELRNYINFLEEELNIPVKIVSVGPNRDQTIVR